MLQTANRNLWLYAVLIFLGAAVLYRLCLPAEYSGDDLQYTMVIERGAQGDLFYHPAGGQPYISQAEAAALEPVPSPPPLNPRYLLEWPTSVLVARLWGDIWMGRFSHRSHSGLSHYCRRIRISILFLCDQSVSK